MYKYDLRPIIKQIETMIQNKDGKDLGASPYDCANAINILYTINALPTDPAVRMACVDALQKFQNKENGLFENAGNFATHTTAFLSGALNLLDAKPIYQAKGFKEYQTREGLHSFLDEIDWAKDPWLGAHLGAGIYGSMLLTNSVSDEWEDYYFEWLTQNADPVTGLWKKDALEGAPWFHYLASSFHYVFNYEYAKRALPYPKELLQTCIKAYRDGECMDFAHSMGWPDIDFTYLLARVQRRAGILYDETQQILSEIADGLIGQLLARDIAQIEALNNINTLFAIVSALALLQDALPGYIRTSKPMKLVLDKRPFI